MAAMEPLCSLLGIKPNYFTKEELLVLEAELLTLIYDALKETFKERYKTYFYLMKYNTDMEIRMLEKNFIRFIIQDILTSGEYNLDGIALYTDTPEETLHDIFAGRNNCAPISLLRKIIELHRTIRTDLYKLITQKITAKLVHEKFIAA